MDAVKLQMPKVSVYTVPTDLPESDGTLAWESTTLVLVEIDAGGKHGLGYSYADGATAVLVRDTLAKVVTGRNALDIAAVWAAMLAAIRNLGRPGIASMAVAAVDNALWDLKAKLLDLSLLDLLGAVREAIPVYGSGGFTSYTDKQLAEQLGGWVESGIGMVKMKVGRSPDRDVARVRTARGAVGGTRLFVDANGAYTRKQALALAHSFAELGVSWFEEPRPSHDLDGLHLLRDRAPPGMDITAGEYGYDAVYFRRMLAADAVDVLQADATRCAGISGLLGVAALCEAFDLPLSSHCAPAIHVQPLCALRPAIHAEYFHDHVRIEQLLFDGALLPVDGVLRPDRTRPGLGLVLKEHDAARYAAH
ncbi:mandelate racemase [Rhodanobacter sp. 7MK24]|nr:mandelate racemase [Rhodanobacter sp. 7MK24]